MSEGLREILRPPPWFGMDDLLVVAGVIALIYWAWRRQSRAGPFW